MSLAQEKGDSVLKYLGIYYRALLLYMQNRDRTATQLDGAIERLNYPRNTNFDIPIIHTVRERYILEAREVLGETDYNAAYAEGRAMTLDQATAYALRELGF